MLTTNDVHHIYEINAPNANNHAEQTLLLSKNIPNLEEMGVVERRPRWSSSSGSSGGSEQHAGDIPRWGVSGQGVEARELTPLSFL